MKAIAIYHLEAKVISRSEGRSAVAAAAYMSCDKIYNDYDGITHDYTKKQGLVWEQVFLPPNAPKEWADRAALWNAVEEGEKTKDSRLAREFVVALPVELKKDEWISLLSEFIRNNFVADGMCADVAIHDTDGHNPHAHIMLTVRPLDEKGKWQNKTEKEYLCVKDGEERGFTAAEFKAAQSEGWEKQYQYKVGRKKVYMPPSAAEAQGYERVSKYPKSTRYGRQNPITERWNSEEQLVLWREAWAAITNKYLSLSGVDETIDHRSFEERGIDEQPTIHEGVTARVLEKKGIVSDRCEFNRQIRADNALFRELKALVDRLLKAVNCTIPKISEEMENLRIKIILAKYQLPRVGAAIKKCSDYLSAAKTELQNYDELTEQIDDKENERSTLVTEKDILPFWNVPKRKRLDAQIAELNEDIQKLLSQQAVCLEKFDRADIDTVRKDIANTEARLNKLKGEEEKISAMLDSDLKEFSELREQAADFDFTELYEARLAIRPEKENILEQKLRKYFGSKYSASDMANYKTEVSRLLNDESVERLMREKARQEKSKVESIPPVAEQQPKKTKKRSGR